MSDNQLWLPGMDPNRPLAGARVKKLAEPDVSAGVKQWGALVGWCRAKQLTPAQVRQQLEDYPGLVEKVERYERSKDKQAGND